MATAEVARPATRAATAAAAAAAAESSGPGPDAPGAPKPECGICFEPISTQGHLDTCKHSFCYTCIKTWLEECNTCPICQRRFTKLTKEELATAGKASAGNAGAGAPRSRSSASTQEEKVSYRDNRGYGANPLLGVPLNALISDMLVADMMRAQGPPNGAVELLFGVLSMLGPARQPLLRFSGAGTRQDPIVLTQGDEDEPEPARGAIFNPFAGLLGMAMAPPAHDEDDEDYGGASASGGGEVCRDCGRVHARPRNLFGAPRAAPRPRASSSSASGGSSSSRRSSGPRRRLALGGSSATASAAAAGGSTASASAATAAAGGGRRRSRARRRSRPGAAGAGGAGAGAALAAGAGRTSGSAAGAGTPRAASSSGTHARASGAADANTRPTKRRRRSSRSAGSN